MSSLTILFWLLPAILFSMIAQYKVRSAYSRYSKVANSRTITGEAAARAILNYHNIRDVRIERVKGNLTDHYSPTDKVIRLSDGVYDRPSIAAACIAAHEAGHAVQHAMAYLPNTIRSRIVPIANIASSFSAPLIILGLLFSEFLIWAGIIAYSLAVLVYLVTLPVEFDASRRALNTLQDTYMLDEKEMTGAKQVLTAAAMTYVASALIALIQLVRLLLSVLTRKK